MNLLIIVYYWPPSAGSGVQRWLKMTKYLADEKGCNVYVYTPSNPDFNLTDETLLDDVHPEVNVIKRKIWEPYRLARLLTGKKVSNTGTEHAKKKDGILGKLMRYVRARFFVPDPRIFWVNPSVRYLKKYIPENDIDCVITSGPPHSLHKIGYKLKHKLSSLKWIMDVRDPISQMDFFEDMGVKGSLRKRYINYEEMIVHNADAVVGTSYSLPQYLVDFDNKKYHTIPNGYDEEDFKDLNKEATGKIIISHAGLFNRYRYSPALWVALKKLKSSLEESGKSLEVHFAGPISKKVLEKARSISGLGEDLKNKGYISHERVLELYSKSSVLLMFANKSEMGTTNVPGKIFELMASGVPVLGFGNPEGDAEYILEKSGCGKVFAYNAEPESILEWLQSSIEDQSLNRDMKFISQFTRKNLSKTYLSLCQSLIDSEN